MISANVVQSLVVLWPRADGELKAQRLLAAEEVRAMLCSFAGRYRAVRRGRISLPGRDEALATPALPRCITIHGMPEQVQFWSVVINVRLLGEAHDLAAKTAERKAGSGAFVLMFEMEQPPVPQIALLGIGGHDAPAKVLLAGSSRQQRSPQRTGLLEKALPQKRNRDSSANQRFDFAQVVTRMPRVHHGTGRSRYPF